MTSTDEGAAAQRPPMLLGSLRRTTLSVALIALAGISLIVVFTDAPAAWWLLGLCAVVTAATLVVTLAEGRYFEPLTLTVAFAATAFVVRPFYLFLNSTDLISFTPPVGLSPVKSLLRLDNAEIAFFATTRLHGPLQAALTRAIGACAVFLVVFIAAYLTGTGARLGRGIREWGRNARRFNVRTAVGLSLIIGFLGQVAIVHKSGGLSRAANTQLVQTALNSGLDYYILAGFSIAGVLIWAAWTPPRSRRAWLGFTLAVLEPCVFYFLVGSRTHVLGLVLALAAIIHYRWRRFRLREVLAAFVVGLVVAGAMLSVRQATRDRPFDKALGSAPAYIVDPRGILNNLTQFDQLFYATSAAGVTIPFKHGAWIGDAFASYFPRFLDPHKPQPPDIVFRKEIFGNVVGAGRPPTLVGDLYLDFGFTSIVVGAALVGILANLLLCLAPGQDEQGRPFRIALYSLSLFVLYELLSNNYAIAIGYVLTLVLPFLAAVFLFGRARLPRAGNPFGRGAQAPRTARERQLVDS